MTGRKKKEFSSSSHRPKETQKCSIRTRGLTFWGLILRDRLFLVLFSAGPVVFSVLTASLLVRRRGVHPEELANRRAQPSRYGPHKLLIEA